MKDIEEQDAKLKDLQKMAKKTMKMIDTAKNIDRNQLIVRLYLSSQKKERRFFNYGKVRRKLLPKLSTILCGGSCNPV